MSALGDRMPERAALVLSLVERGWRGARECSLVLAARGIAVTHLIKGSLEPEVLAVIKVRPEIRIADVPRPVFRLALWIVLIGQTLAGRLRWVMVDNERTLRAVTPWCALCRLVPVLIEPDGNGYALSVGGRVESLEAVFGLARSTGPPEKPAPTSAPRSQSTCSGAETGASSASHNGGR